MKRLPPLPHVGLLLTLLILHIGSDANAQTDSPFLSLTVEKRGSEYFLEITNLSDAPVSYLGYGAEGSNTAVYKEEVFREGKWTDISPGWCGTGMGPCELAPHRSVKFRLYVDEAKKDGERFRISVSAIAKPKAAYRSGVAPETVYSPVYLIKRGNLLAEQTAASR